MYQKQILYETAFVIFIFRYVVLFYSEFSSKVPNSIQNVCYFLITVLLFVKMLIGINFKLEISKQFLLYVTLIVGIGVGIELFELNFVDTILLIVLSFDIDVKKIVKICCIELIILVLSIVALCILGFLPNIVHFKENVIRYGLGFSYVGAVGSFYLHIVLMIMYLKKEKLRWRVILLLSFFEFIVYYYDRFTGNLLLTLFSIISYCVFVKLNINMLKIKSFWNLTSRFLYPLVVAFSLFFSCVFFKVNSVFLNNFDDLLNNRLSIPAKVIEMEGIHFFAHNFQTIGLGALNSGASINQYNYIDNGFLNLILRYGLLISIMVCYIYTKSFIFSVKNNEKVNIIWLIVIIIQSLIYSNIINIANNMFIIIAFSSFFQNNMVVQKRSLQRGETRF